MKSLKELIPFDIDDVFTNRVSMKNRVTKLVSVLQPYEAYLVLKELFGDDLYDGHEDKVQFNYEFSYADFFVEIYDYRMSHVSIALFHDDNNKKEQADQLAVQIEKLLVTAALTKKNIVQKIIKNSKQKLLTNTYLVYYQTAESLLEMAKMHESLSEASEDPMNDDLPLDLHSRNEDLYRSAFLMFLSSFEGLLNIVYELYIKKELREERLSKRISREQVDIKFRMAPVYCNGFKVSVIDHTDERFRQYLQLIDIRNDFVHANLNTAMESHVVHDEHKTFIIEPEKKSVIPKNIALLSYAHIELTKKYVDDAVTLLIESLDVKTKHQFTTQMTLDFIEIELVDGELIIL